MNDIARCVGVGSYEDSTWNWREGCEHCLRRTAPIPDDAKRVQYISPPEIIVFECEYLIEDKQCE